MARSTARTGCLVLVGLLVLFAVFAVLAPESGRFSLGRRVAIVPVVGEIRDASRVVDDIEHFVDDPTAAAIVLRVDTPGGAVGASQEMYAAVQRARSESDKPIVVSMGDVAASGGYYLACAADSVFANPGTLTGSIGVIMEIPDVSGAMGKVGVRMQVIKSGQLKDIGSPYRTMTPEERAALQSVIDDTYEQFVDAVAEGRGLSREKVLALATGNVMTGRQAKAAGLVDQLGDLEDAVRAAGAMAGISGTPSTTQRSHRRWWWDRFDEKWAGAERALSAGPRLLYRLP